MFGIAMMIYYALGAKPNALFWGKQDSDMCYKNDVRLHNDVAVHALDKRIA